MFIRWVVGRWLDEKTANWAGIFHNENGGEFRLPTLFVGPTMDSVVGTRVEVEPSLHRPHPCVEFEQPPFTLVAPQCLFHVPPIGWLWWVPKSDFQAINQLEWAPSLEGFVGLPIFHFSQWRASPSFALWVINKLIPFFFSQEKIQLAWLGWTYMGALAGLMADMISYYFIIWWNKSSLPSLWSV